MSKPTALVVGASRGIGKELALQLCQTHSVYGTMRKPCDVEGKFNVIQMDMKDQASVDKAAKQIDRVDLLIVNAAIGHDDKILETSTTELGEYLDSNLIGVHRSVLAFLPALRKGQEKKIILISSTSGSCTLQLKNPPGFNGPYSVTKAALNMLTIQYNNELHGQGFTLSPIHPGWVGTDMGSEVDGGKGAISIPESVEGIVQVINGLTHDKSGTFYNYKGEVLPW